MSKTTSYKPAYANGTYKINGKTRATTKKVGDTVNSNFNMNKNEKAVYDYAQQTLADILPQINTFSPETLSNIQSQLNAYQKQGEQSINNIYTPLLNNLKNDMASRFGNIDNSMFLDKLSGIENSRTDAIAQLAESLMSKRNELVNNELSNRFNLINLLNTLQNQYNNTAMNSIAAALNAANSAKGYGQQSSSSFPLDLNQLLTTAFSFL